MHYFEPYKIKMIEPIPITTKEERLEIIKKAGYNVFNIPAEKVTIDLLTDSGTSAMSQNQWSGIMIGDESYAGSRNFFNLEKTVKEIFGYKHVIPTHQGRVTENILFQNILSNGDYVLSNTLFDTTRANILTKGGRAVDMVIDEAYNIDSDFPFKGNMDPEKLEIFLKKHGPENVALVILTITNNSGGGQPVSMGNIKEISSICHRYNIPLFFDAARYAENCYFIKQREKEYENKSILEIAQELFSYGDGATMSAKKDALVNIGGFITLNNDKWASMIKTTLILIEGFPTYGGLAGRDLEAISRGLKEALDEEYLRARIAQVQYLGKLLDDTGVPYLKPAGGHAVYLDGLRILPHIKRENFPSQALTCALYTEGGIRAVEIGGLMFGEKDIETGEVRWPKLDLVRLAIPRRVYTNSHIAYIADIISAIYKKRDSIKGLRIVKEPPYLRHFTVVLEEI